MADRPILFSGSMIRAILREIEQPGSGKTQTRRIIKPQPIERVSTIRHVARETATGRDVFNMYDAAGSAIAGLPTGDGLLSGELISRIGAGDRLWVREAHALLPRTAYRGSIGTGTISQREHPTDGYSAAVFREGFDRSGRPPWRPSIHMPRWASRLTLYVTEVRVERLQDISEADAIAEGIARDTVGNVREFFVDQESTKDMRDDMPLYFVRGDDRDDALCFTAREAYSRLWESINGVGTWDENPWVAAYTFVPLLKNIDAAPAQVAGAENE